MTDKTPHVLLNHRELARVQLGASLRKLRLRTTLTQTALGRATHMSQPKISKIEMGDLPPNIDDLHALLTALKPSPADEEKIFTQFDLLDLPDGDRKKIYQLGIAAKQREFHELESRARRIRVFDTSLIPGLLQTEAYARAIVTGLAPFSAEQIDQAVAERMRRQEHLENPEKSFEFIVLEAALWALHCSVDEQRAQLHRLRELRERPNIRFGIVRADAPLPNVINAFWLFDEEYVSAETIASEVVSLSPDAIAEYIRVFNKLAAVATFDGSDADDAIRNAMTSLERRS